MTLSTGSKTFRSRIYPSGYFDLTGIKMKIEQSQVNENSLNDQMPIYMDYQATTPVDPRVFQAMTPYFTLQYGNPHSRTHVFGWNAEKAVEEARAQVAKLINADPTEVIFTSGATESNNLALKGVARYYRASGKNHIITTPIEHKCVIDTCRNLEDEGFEVTYLRVNQKGLINLDELRAAIKPNTAIVSIMALNNEIGAIQPIAAIGQICRQNKVFFHTDAAQAFGKIPLDVKKMNIDLMSISGHKIYAPKGIGALYVGKKPRVRIQPLISGGGQERGMRSGTLPTPLVVGFGVASELAMHEMNKDHTHIEKLSNIFLEEVLSIPDVYLNGAGEHHYPGCLNISFAYVEGESMIGALKGVAVSSGSACTSSSLEPSYVLHALGIDEDLAHTSLRFGIGRFTTENDVRRVVEVVRKAVEKLRAMSPLWDMVQSGVDIKSISWVGH